MSGREPELERRRELSWLRELVDYALAGAFLYLSLHPEKADELTDRARALRARWQARLSVWRARREIRSLPEVDRPCSPS